jgi:hypothetical protein
LALVDEERGLNSDLKLSGVVVLCHKGNVEIKIGFLLYCKVVFHCGCGEFGLDVRIYRLYGESSIRTGNQFPKQLPVIQPATA